MTTGALHSTSVFNGVKVFSATMARTRTQLSEQITNWIQAHPEYEIVDTVVAQSSDDAFHCLTYVIFYNGPS